jgi:23S rRNA (uracil1939-C5)-methyltransferase
LVLFVIERLSIERLGHRGDGLAAGPNGPVYVPYTLPGEIVEVEAWQGHPDRRHLLRVEQPSAERIAPICPHFGICGGCALQHWREDRYRAWKRDLVITALTQAGLRANVDALVDAHGEGRRRAVFHARRTTHGVLQVGFAALHAHHIVGIDHCPILAPGLKGTIEVAWAIAERLAPEAKPLDIQVTATEAGLDVDVRGSGRLSPQRLGALACLADKHRIARLTRHGELVVQRAKPIVRMGRAAVPLPPGAFLQPTTEGETTLGRLVTMHVDSARSVADLFAGIGSFALRLAERARVIAVDADDAAVTALREASATTSGLKPIDAVRRDLFRQPLVARELTHLDAVVFDPPRQGAEQQASQLARSTVPRVVAVSCNHASFARDAKILESGGYRLTAVTPIDQFRYTAHVEIVACFVR